MSSDIGITLKQKALQKHFEKLADAITDPDRFASKLYSKGFITRGKREAITSTMGISRYSKALQLLDVVEARVRSDPNAFKKFVRILKSVHGMQVIGDAVLGSYCKLLAAQGIEDSPSPPESDSDDDLAVAVQKDLKQHHTEPVQHQPVSQRSPLLLSYQEKAPNKSAQQYAKYLRAFYQSRTLPVDTKWPPTPSKRYINLAIIQREPANREEAYELTSARFFGNIDEILKQKKPITLEMFLQPEGNRQLKCILVEGSPGVGKSTFSWEICRQWQELEAMKRFTLVILIQLRDRRARNASSLSDIVYHRDKSLQEAVVQWIEDMDGDGTLFVLDGFDELPSQQRAANSIFTDLIHGIYLPKSVVVVTSRPSATAEFLHNYKPLISRHAEILGFTQDNIKTYAESIFGCDTKLFHQYMEYIEANPLIHSMMYIPLNAVIVTEVFKESLTSDRPVPRTMTQLYNILSLTLLRRHLLVENPDTDAPMPASLTDLPMATLSMLCKVRELAFQGICDEQLTFSNLPLDFHHLGFMNKVTSLYIDEGTDVSFNFLHLTLQEFLAAHHISLLSPEQQQQLFRKYSKKPHFEVVWRFVAGLTNFSGITWHGFLIQSVFRGSVYFEELLEVDYYLSSFGLRCLFEAQDPRACSMVCGTGRVGYQPESAYPFDLYALGYCIANSSATWSLSFPYSKVTAESLGMLALGLQSEPTGCSQIEAIVIGDPKISVTNTGSEGIRNIAQIPTIMLHSLHTLKLGGCNLNAVACTYLSQSTSLLSNLHTLHLENNPFEEGGATDLFQALVGCGKKLRNLSVHSCNLGDSDIYHLRELLSHNRSLQALSIGDGNMSLECVKALLNTVLEPTSLTDLSLVDVQLQDVVILLTQLMTANTNLVSLRFSCCEASANVVSGISKAMRHNKTLRKLSMRKCSGVDQTAVRYFVEIVESNSSLQELHVKQDIDVSGCMLLLQALCDNTVLTTLALPTDYKIIKTSSSCEKVKSVSHRVIWTL